MTQKATYSVLQYFPHANRSEHANVGVIVAMPDGNIRAHIARNLKKVRSLDPHADLEAIRAWETEIPKLAQDLETRGPAAFGVLRDFGGVSIFDSESQFLFSSERDYQAMIDSALKSLVETSRARAERREPTSRLFLDIKRAFSSNGWLGVKQADIRNHKIVPRYLLAGDAAVTAEFALRNGRLHIVETVDFRISTPSAKRQEALSKALVIDFAADVEGTAINSYVIVAGATSDSERPVLSLLRHYSENIVMWESREEVSSFLAVMARATGNILPPEMPTH
jgi:hypothetical protein